MRRYSLVIVIALVSLIVTGILGYEFGRNAALGSVILGLGFCIAIVVAVPVMDWTTKNLGITHAVYGALAIIFIVLSMLAGGVKFGGSYISEIKSTQQYVTITENKVVTTYILHPDGEFGTVDAATHKFFGVGSISSTSIKVYNGPEFSIVWAVKFWVSGPVFAVAPREYPIMLEFSN